MKMAVVATAGLAAPRLLRGKNAPAASGKKPNIVVILADDLGLGDLSCYNPKGKVPTPNLDKLADEGMRFTDAHTSAAQCSPTRYGLITGQYAWRTRLKTGVLKHFEDPLIDKGRLTVASLLKDNGYATAGVGKWHLGWGWVPKAGQTIDKNSWSDKECEKVDFTKPLTACPLDHGFDYYFGIGSSNNMQPYCYIENNKVVVPPTTKKKHPVYDTESGAGLVSDDYVSEEIDQVLWSKAKGWLDRHFKAAPRKPFFLYMPTSAIHRPCLATKEFRGKSGAGLHGDKVVELDNILKVDLPANAGEDSYSILPVLLGEKLAKPLREATIMTPWSAFKSVRQGPWKLILGNNSGGYSLKRKIDTPGQLYNLDDDPGETTNLHAKHPDKVKALTAIVKKYESSGRSAPPARFAARV